MVGRAGAPGTATATTSTTGAAAGGWTVATGVAGAAGTCTSTGENGLIEARREILPEGVADSAEASLGAETSSAELADHIAAFFRRRA